MTSFRVADPFAVTEVKLTTGRVFEESARFTADADVDPATIQARTEFRKSAVRGTELASMATAEGGDADGTISVRQVSADPEKGVWTYEAQLRLPDSFTGGIDGTPFVNPETGASRAWAWGDLKVWAPSVQDGAAFHGGKFKVFIDCEVTA